MEFIIIGVVAFLASGLTLYSGFGLGTLLTPFFALFFPAPAAVAMTALVHLANNGFKLFLFGKAARRDIVLKFGIPAILAALAGAILLSLLSDLEPLTSYRLFGNTFFIRPVSLMLGVLLMGFALIEFFGSSWSVDEKFLPLGGFLSGFFGGLSGNQGALRSAFLLRCKLSKETFIGTGVVIACLIDVSRLFIYSSRFDLALYRERFPLLLTAILAAFLGAYLGAQFLKKVTIKFIQYLVGIMLLVIGALLVAGII
jgi:uncharacterized protein